MITFTEKDIATPGAQISHEDTIATIQRSDPKTLWAMLHWMNHPQFLLTPYWRAVANQVKARDGHKCRLCTSSDRPEVHHPHYNNKGNDHLHMDELITLCHVHHQKTHGHEPRPAYKPVPKVKAGKSAANNIAHAAYMKTPASGDRLTPADLQQHARIHRDFSPDKLRAWMDSVPFRWTNFKTVADANRAFRGHQ